MLDKTEPRVVKDRVRPVFPKRAVITGGMPYGNKDLHFGHIGGVFVQADCFARFLRDRIGQDHVIFVSGTDCYGSPIVEYHRRAVEKGEFMGSLEDFVAYNHQRQKEALAAYHVEPNLFAASGMAPYRGIHELIGAWFLETLHRHGHLLKLTTPQFYDPEREVFLNGRQVQGKCPVLNCNSEEAYADECSLGHQYEPRDLLQPVSTLTGKTPEMRDVINWYLDLPKFREALEPWLCNAHRKPSCRQYMISYIQEFFEPPTIHVTKDQFEAVTEIADRFPEHRQEPGKGKSMQYIFASMDALEKARAMMAEHGIRYRIGKTLVPFRLTGNLDWGLKAPDLEGLEGLTFWVWPESLWAPISFCAAYLEQTGHDPEAWKDWWCNHEAAVYQFIGEDNIFFYGLAQAGIWLGMQGPDYSIDPPDGDLRLTELVANKHILFLDKKASSSGKVKPPMACEILDYYTADQLRTHFFSMGLGQRSVGFRPKPLNPAATEKEGDPVLKEGNLLRKTFNRAVRSCFYTAQKYYETRIPVGEISAEVREQCENAILDFEETMFKHEFHVALVKVADFIRAINKRWNQDNPYQEDTDETVRCQALIDAFQMVKTATVLMHPIAPVGTEKIRDYLRLGPELWCWDRVFDDLYSFMDDPEQHQIKELEPRHDFFEKHPSQ